MRMDSGITGQYAPIALFVYNRPEHTRRTLVSLSACPEFAASPLYVFCDGPKGSGDREPVRQTRAVVAELVGGLAQVRETDRNRGLASSIIAGVTELCTVHGRAIVVEDDLLVRPVFLKYLNGALDRYAQVDRVMQVSAYMFAVKGRLDPSRAFFLPITTSWGWATWKRAWDLFDPRAVSWEQLSVDRELRRNFDCGGSYPYAAMLEQQMTGQLDSWAIRWYWSVFRRAGLTLFPPTSLVENIGFDGSGTHGWRRARSALQAGRPARLAEIGLPDELVVDEVAFALVREKLGNVHPGLLARMKKFFGLEKR